MLKKGVGKEMYSLIVGATSEIAKEFIKQNPGKKYILTEIPKNYDALKQFIEEIQIDGTAFVLDVKNIREIEDLFQKFNREDVKIEELIYIAGINYLCEAVQTTEAIWDEVNAINLKGCFFVMKEAGKNMILHNVKGRIVNIASQHGMVGNLNRAAYCASKAGLINLNKVLALEWAPYGIRVNSVSPTFILYNKNEEFFMNAMAKKEYLKNIPMKRYCNAQDVSNAISFLLAEENEMITGHNLVVDGGWTIK